MRYQSSLYVVKDINKAVEFYKAVLGLEVICDFGANKTLTGGFALQTLDTWADFIKKDKNQILQGHNAAELYFEEDDFDAFLMKLKAMPFIEYVHEVKQESWGQRGVRFYDLDKNIIEVGENLDAVVMRFIKSGMTVEQTAKRMDVPIDFVAEVVARVGGK